MNATQMIDLYNNLFFVSLTVAAIGFLAAVALFFLLDIPTVFALMTGRAQKRTIERMQVRNRSTGRLRSRAKETSIPVKEAARHEQPSGGKARNMRTAVPQAEPAKSPVPAKTDAAETSLLQEEGAETSLLSYDAVAEEATSQKSKQKTNALFAGTSEMTARLTAKEAKPSSPTGLFKITEETMMIHTKEVINERK